MQKIQMYFLKCILCNFCHKFDIVYSGLGLFLKDTDVIVGKIYFQSLMRCRLSRHILWIGVANFILCPLIFIWQILYSFFRYAEVCYD